MMRPSSPVGTNSRESPLLLDPNALRPSRLPLRRLLLAHFHWKCLLCSLLISLCVFHVSYCLLCGPKGSVHSLSLSPGPCSHGYNLIPMALGVLFYMIYISECWHFRSQLCSLPRLGAAQVEELSSAMRSAVPVVWWKSVSYHYLRRSRQVARYRNGDVVTRTQVYYERVNSHQSGNVFLYDQCGYKDISKQIGALHQFPMVKMRFSKGFVFACLQAANEFEDQRTRFFTENEMLDDYMEVREGLDLANLPFVMRALVFPERKFNDDSGRRASGGGRKLFACCWPRWHPRCGRQSGQTVELAAGEPQLRPPWWLSGWAFWPASVLLLSWPLRMVAELSTGHLHFQVTKLFGTNYISPSSVNYTGPLTRTSTMDSRELELANRHNYLVVPSYSEAILLDPYQESMAQPTNLFRQFFSSPRRQPPPPSISHYAPHPICNDYGAMAKCANSEKMRNGFVAGGKHFMSPVRSQSLASFGTVAATGRITFQMTNQNDQFQCQRAQANGGNGSRGQGRHLPRRPSNLQLRGANCWRERATTGNRNRGGWQRQPPRSATISEGIVAAAFVEDDGEIDADCRGRGGGRPANRCSDREPLLGNRRGESQRHQLQRAPMGQPMALLAEQQTTPNEPPPPYEFALRYCSPIYQRLRQSAHSLSSLFSRRSSLTCRDQRQQHGLDNGGSLLAGAEECQLQNGGSSTHSQC